MSCIATLWNIPLVVEFRVQVQGVLLWHMAPSFRALSIQNKRSKLRVRSHDTQQCKVY